MNTLLNKLQDHVFICNIWINLGKKEVCWSLNFLKNFMLNIINNIFKIYVIEVLKWFGG
jgi:hypothetical protein